MKKMNMKKTVGLPLALLVACASFAPVYAMEGGASSPAASSSASVAPKKKTLADRFFGGFKKSAAKFCDRVGVTDHVRSEAKEGAKEGAQEVADDTMDAFQTPILFALGGLALYALSWIGIDLIGSKTLKDNKPLYAGVLPACLLSLLGLNRLSKEEGKSDESKTTQNIGDTLDNLGNELTSFGRHTIEALERAQSVAANLNIKVKAVETLMGQSLFDGIFNKNPEHCKALAAEFKGAVGTLSADAALVGQSGVQYVRELLGELVKAKDEKVEDVAKKIVDDIRAKHTFSADSNKALVTIIETAQDTFGPVQTLKWFNAEYTVPVA